MFNPEQPTGPRLCINCQKKTFPSNRSLALKSGDLALGHGTGWGRAVASRPPVAPGYLGM